MSLYKEELRHICLILQDVLSSIYILCDSWTAPNALRIFRIIGHFINKEAKPQALLLALVQVEKAQMREQLAVHMFIVLGQYHIQDCLGYFVIDNVIANNCIVIFISHQLFEKYELIFNSQHYWLRCNGYIINLFV